MEPQNSRNFGHLVAVPSSQNEGEHHICFSTVHGEQYLGVKVTQYDPKFTGEAGLATFEINGKMFASHLEWYGPAFGFTAEHLDKLPSDEKAPEALGKTILGKVRAATEQFLMLKELVEPVMPAEGHWRAQLSKTVNYLQRNSKSIMAPQVIRKKGVLKEAGVELNDFSAPGFTLEKTKKGLYLKINVPFRHNGAKIIKHIVELSSQMMCFRKIPPKRGRMERFWTIEVEFSKKLIEQKESKINMTGILVPEEIIEKHRSNGVVEQHIIEEKGIGSLVEYIVDHIEGRRNITNDQKLQIAFEIAQGLYTLHTHFEVAHRDIKPDNVIRFKDRVCITDWEFICPRPNGNNGTDVFGTTKYFAPEMKKLLALDEEPKKKGLIPKAFQTFTHLLPGEKEFFLNAYALDAWYFGVLMCMLYTEKTPKFCGKIERDTFKQLVEKEQSAILKNPKVPSYVRKLIHDLLMYKPKERKTITAARHDLNIMLP